MSESKFDPMKEINRLSQTVGKVIEQGISTVQSTVERASTNTSVIRVDMYEVDDMIVIQTNAIDSILPDSIEINMEADVLTIQCETQAEKTPAHASYYLQERRFGILVRTVTIPVPVISDKAKAKLKNGCLTVTLPVDKSRMNEVNVQTME